MQVRQDNLALQPTQVRLALRGPPGRMGAQDRQVRMGLRGAQDLLGAQALLEAPVQQAALVLQDKEAPQELQVPRETRAAQGLVGALVQLAMLDQLA